MFLIFVFEKKIFQANSNGIQRNVRFNGHKVITFEWNEIHFAFNFWIEQIEWFYVIFKEKMGTLGAMERRAYGSKCLAFGHWIHID